MARSPAQERSALPISLAFPAAEATIRGLRAGDEVLVSGTAFTAREPAHRSMLRGPSPVLGAWTAGAALYHCGPVVVRGPSPRTPLPGPLSPARFWRGGDPVDSGWRFAAAGPSDSMREEPWAAAVVERYGIRAIIGRGGMGPATGAALARFGVVYLHATGALAVTLARHVARVESVHLLDELGLVEAIWRVELRDFPATVTMDAHGASLHARRAGED